MSFPALVNEYHLDNLPLNHSFGRGICARCSTSDGGNIHAFPLAGFPPLSPRIGFKKLFGGFSFRVSFPFLHSSLNVFEKMYPFDQILNNVFEIDVVVNVMTISPVETNFNLSIPADSRMVLEGRIPAFLNLVFTHSW